MGKTYALDLVLGKCVATWRVTFFRALFMGALFYCFGRFPRGKNMN